MVFTAWEGVIVQILQLQRKIGPEICSECFYFCFWSQFFVIVDDFQLVRSFNCENLSLLYVFTRVPHAFKIFTQPPFVVGSVYIMYCSVLSWFTLRSLGFSISDALCLKLSMELWLLVIRIFQININLIFLVNDAVVMFSDMVRNIWFYIQLCIRMIC